MRAKLLMTVVAGLVATLLATPSSGEDLKVALHVLPRGVGSCEAGLPEITDCADIISTYEGCDAFDVFPVFFGLTEVSRIEYGLTWPEAWGDCVFTPCAGDNIIGDIILPGDGVIHEWDQCHVAWSIVTGYASFDPVTLPGTITPTANPQTGLMVATNCSGGWVFSIGLASAGICGLPGDDPCSCGCPSDQATWSSIKLLFQ
jgi:hypothetical protein